MRNPKQKWLKLKCKEYYVFLIREKVLQRWMNLNFRKFMPMKNSFFYHALLCGVAVVYTACSVNDDAVTDDLLSDKQTKEWSAYVTASHDSIAEDNTRALFYGGNTKRYANLWDEGDIVHVYKGNTEVGTMTPTVYGLESATLSGTLTGPFAVNDALTLYLPSKAMDFTGQTGTIYDMSLKYSFQTSTTSVTEASDNILSLNNVTLGHRVFYVRFYLSDSEAPNGRLHPRRIEIHGVSGGDAVQSVAEDGTITYGDLVIQPTEMEDGEYPGEPFISMYNASDWNTTYRIKAYVGDDIYVGPIEGQNAFKPALPNFNNGKLTNVRRRMLKTTAVSTLTVEDIADKTFTGSPITPAVTVQDGTTTLTQGTDYSVNYTDNVAAGTATVTVTGLADAGAVAATKYLGKTTATFSIVKAAPVITMETGDVELVNTATGGHTVTAVTIADGSVDLTAAPHSCSISYESSDPSVATVDAATGVVTGVSSGTCTITAKVAGTGNWNEATSQYTVRVSTSADATNTISTWGNGGSEDDTINL